MDAIRNIFITGFVLTATATPVCSNSMTAQPTGVAAETKVTVQTAEAGYLRNWTAGKQVSIKSINEFGLDRCFTAEPVSDAVFKRMKGKTWKANCTVSRESLRYVKVLHYTANKKIQTGELVCSKVIANDIIAIFRELYHKKYPIERMVLIDNYDADDERSMTANNTSCFNFRRVAGSRHLSKHSQGRAIDINPLYNPCVRHTNGRQDISPKAGQAYADRSKKDIPYKIDRNDLCYKLFKAHGFTWGGEWKSVKDYQHFEK